jgi:hypothetical protein
VLLDLTAERLYELQRDFWVLQDQMVKCYAMLGSTGGITAVSGAATCRYLGDPLSA